MGFFVNMKLDKLKRKAIFCVSLLSMCACLILLIFDVKHISKDELVYITLTDSENFIAYCGSCDMFDYYTCFLFRYKTDSSECTINPHNKFKFDNFKTKKKVTFNPYHCYFTIDDYE